MTDLASRLQNGVVLAELGGYGDGPYCAEYGAGAALVLMGTYIVDSGDAVPYDPRFVFRPGRESYAGYLREHVPIARRSGAAVGVSVICVDQANDRDFLLAAQEAGADYLSLCLHSSMAMFTDRGLSSALLQRANWPRLRDQLRALLGAIEAPFIAKIGIEDTPDAAEAVEQMVKVGVQIIHANIGDAASVKGLALTRRLSEVAPVLIIGGGIATEEAGRSVLEAGADAIAAGTAAMEDATLCGRLQKALRG
jgi:tRNA-dihydrouridine synthase